MVGQFPPHDPGEVRTEVSATVKWYNPNKGFGFVQPGDGSADAFLHASVVGQAGYQELGEGSVLVCDIAAGPRGPQVTAIHSVEAGSGPPLGEHRSRPSFGGAPQGETIEGRVKFFNVEKGFGFIAPDGGGQDVFVSARTLTKSGLTTLESDQRVRATTRMGQKGPMADQVDLL
jgi:CspA family cold shock protein